MFAQSIRTITSRRMAPAAVRAFSSTPSVYVQDPKKPNSERHAMHKAKKDMEGGLDNQSASVQAGLKAAESGKASETYDAAMSSKGGQAKHSELKEEALQNANSDNEKAQSGSFMAQVGGQPSDRPSGSVGQKEEATPPGIMAAAKNALGLGTSKKEHEDNKTAGGGSYRSLHTSARRLGDASDGAKEDGTGSRTLVDGGVVGDQNPHLKHKRPEEEDMGKGNAATDPHLPSKSHSRAALDQHSDNESQQKARMHTSARQLAAKPAAGYVDGKVPEPKQAGYDAPSQAYPSVQLNERPNPANPNLVPSSELPRASTGQGPAHPLAQAAKEGAIPSRNPPPDAKAGQLGLGEAWKDRTAQVDK